MGAGTDSNGKRWGLALLGLGLLGLAGGWYLAEPGGSVPAAESSPGSGASVASPFFPDQPQSAQGPAEPGPFIPSVSAPGQQTTSAATPSDAQLHETEVERLREVFLTTVYPLFQSEFRLDEEGRSAIDVFVASLPEDLGNGDLDAISAMIEAQLAGPEAEDLAFVITHLYRLEQEEARLVEEAGPVTSMADQLETQERLSQLRERWFGPELSTILFGGTDAADAGSGQAPPENVHGVSEEEGTPAELAEEQTELADIESAWEQRYQRFLAEKQVIVRAGLDQSEKDLQIEALLRQHYSPREIEAARAFDQARE